MLNSLDDDYCEEHDEDLKGELKGSIKVPFSLTNASFEDLKGELKEGQWSM